MKIQRWLFVSLPVLLFTVARRIISVRSHRVTIIVIIITIRALSHQSGCRTHLYTTKCKQASFSREPQSACCGNSMVLLKLHNTFIKLQQLWWNPLDEYPLWECFHNGSQLPASTWPMGTRCITVPLSLLPLCYCTLSFFQQQEFKWIDHIIQVLYDCNSSSFCQTLGGPIYWTWT